MFKQGPNGVELHVASSTGHIIPKSGPLAGLRVKLLGKNVVRGGTPVRLVPGEERAPYFFDAAYVVKPVPAIDPEAAAATNKAVKNPEPLEANDPVVESFRMSAPTEANPFADIQVATFDDDEAVSAGGVSAAPGDADTAVDPEELMQLLQERDLRKFGITDVEFTALCLSKAQVWKIYEQVIGRSTNRPTIQQAVAAVLKKSRANAADYSRVVSVIKRVRESENAGSR